MLITDLSKAFGCLRQDLLIVKLAAYNFDQPLLCFVFSYLSDRTQRTKVNNAYILILKLNMVFRKMIYWDLFLWDYKCNIASYADDNSPYTSDISLN